MPNASSAVKGERRALVLIALPTSAKSMASSKIGHLQLRMLPFPNVFPNSPRAQCRLAVLLALAACLSAAPLAAQSDLVAILRARVAARPGDSSSWRLLGRTLRDQNDLAGARFAFEQAVATDPESAAAHHDLAYLLAAGGDLPAAAEHWRQTIVLAPGTQYAEEAAAELARVMPQADSPYKLASFEVDWLDSMRPELGQPDQPPLPPPSPLWVRLEMGALYNSNVQLSPISRELASGDRASAQLYFSPTLELRYLRSDVWTLGTLFRGYYNANEPGFRQFNLQHQEPGLFVEHAKSLETVDLLSRLEYSYAYDLFDFHTLGTRHAVNGSVAAQTCSGRIWTLYGTVDYTDFADDGVEPSITSLDGSSQTIGLSHSKLLDWSWLSVARVGGEFQNAPLTGSNFAFRGTMLYADAEIPCPWGCLLVLQGAHGNRNYPDFQFTPARDENIWRAGAELRKPLSACWSISGNFLYDRFASKNEQFDASRYTTGMFAVFQQ